MQSLVLPGRILESKDMHVAIFQKKCKKGQQNVKKGKILANFIARNKMLGKALSNQYSPLWPKILKYFFVFTALYDISHYHPRHI